MGETVFESGNSVKVNMPVGDPVEMGELTEDAIKNITKERGMKRFTLKDKNGNIIEADDLPRKKGEFWVSEYNAAK